LCHEGSGVFVIGGKVLPFQSGDVSVISENEPHFACSARGTTSDWTWIWLNPPAIFGKTHPTATWLSTSPLGGGDFHNLFGPAREHDIAPLVEALIQEMSCRDSHWNDAAQGLLTALFCHFHRQASRSGRSLPAGGFQQLGPALDYLSSHYAGPIDLGALARLCGMSLTHFRRRFLTVLGKSPHRYLVELRVNAVAAALHDPGKRVTEAAFDAGFSTLCTFNRAFRNVLGSSPREWREKQLSGESSKTGITKHLLS
jgi:AraC-like DNA-binding protein